MRSTTVRMPIVWARHLGLDMRQRQVGFTCAEHTRCLTLQVRCARRPSSLALGVPAGYGCIGTAHGIPAAGRF
jgi:hypothetical protein